MSKGGQRWGAGRPGWKVKAEDCRSIDVRRWHRDGILRPGGAGEWAWWNGAGRTVASVAYSVTADAVALRFAFGGHAADSGGRVTTQAVPILRTPCNCGGDRLWFACPHCTRRVAVLYLRPATGFACRNCAQVAYTSQSEDAMARAWRQQGKAERRLLAGMARPTGMHSTTHGRLLGKIIECQERRLAVLTAWSQSALRGG
jgi:hypothetical protein